MTYIDESTKNLSKLERTRFNILYNLSGRKSSMVAFFWWAVFGAFGGHRFYLRHYGHAFMMCLLTIVTCGVGGIAGVIDGLNIRRLVHEFNKEKILKTVKVVKSI
ncbi:TM2 domain-containing protein [Bacillus sp. Bos-x628]|uniref:TM2 domain-containing protein n=1 Tax=Bacillus maqinnsis TaxID=3229854 RepID=UPI00338FBD1D